MDALKALAGQQGCSADGTSATQNPLSKLINQVSSDGRPVGPLPHQRNDMDQAMAAGMGLQQGPRINRARPNIHGLMPNQTIGNQFDFGAHMSRGPEIQGQGPVVHEQAPISNDWAQEFSSNAPQQAHYPPNQFQQPPMMQNRWMPQQYQPMRPPMGYYQPPMNTMPLHRHQQQPLQQVPKHQTPQTTQVDNKSWVKEAKVVHEDVKDHAKEAVNSDNLKKATEELVEVMKSDEKMMRSNFYSEMNKIAKGDSVVTDNTIEQLRNSTDDDITKMQTLFEEAYEKQLAGEEVDLEEVFNEAVNQADNFDKNPIYEQAWQSSLEETNVYKLTTQNKFKDQDTEENLFEVGMQLFNKGELKEAILAFQAVVDKDLGNSEAWRMLGVVHQELDEDRKAILCLENAKEQDPYNLNALLELGVSYVNELDQKKALSNLKAWVHSNPKFAGVQVDDIYGDEGSDLMHDVGILMAKVEEFAPQDPDVQVVLGVLFNVSKDYDQAVNAFQKALNSRPDDYSLWNKLGATLANSSKSAEALPVYTRAIELKPRYARGWLNFGISHSNLGDYEMAIRAYLRALDLNPDAVHIWSYLRICLTVSEGYDELMPAISKRNIEPFREFFDF